MRQFLREAGLSRWTLRGVERAQIYNWRQLKPEVARAFQRGRHVLDANAGEGEFTRRLLREVLGPEQILTALGAPTQGLSGLARQFPGRLIVVEGGLCCQPDLNAPFDLVVMGPTLYDLELHEATPLGIIATAVQSVAPRGRLLLLDKVLDGVAAESGEILAAGLHAELVRLRGGTVFGLRRLDEYRTALAGAGLTVTRSALIGQDPGPYPNRVRAAFLGFQREEMADRCPAETRAEAEKLIDEAIERITRAPQGPLPLAAIIARRTDRPGRSGRSAGT